MLDFETVISRGEDSEKWRGAKAKGELPLWVADMDFPCAPAIQQALRQRVEEQIYGYTTGMDEEYRAIVCAYYARHFNWTFDPQDIYFTGGVVQAISILCGLLCEEGEGIVIQTPVYHPFRRQIEAAHRRCVVNPLIRHADGSYTMDLVDLEAKFQDPGVKGILLCSPHNPVGRVWRAKELQALAELAERYDKWIISDEIHADIVKAGITHHVLDALCPQLADRIITCTAPTKTFNMAGVECSHVIIHDPQRKALWEEKVVRQLCISEPNCFAISALKAAYTQCDEWRAQMNRKVDENARWVEAILREQLPKAIVSPREGTYLMWVDFSAYEADPQMLDQRIREGARVHFNDGVMFGTEGAGFQRINIACPHVILQEAMTRVIAELKR